MPERITPILLLTGYLGSGKTTMVNHILSNNHGIRFAVIVNDIGEVNLDASLIERGGVVGKKDESLVALQNGCICCTLKMDLVEQLRDITSQRRFDKSSSKPVASASPPPSPRPSAPCPPWDPSMSATACLSSTASSPSSTPSACATSSAAARTSSSPASPRKIGRAHV